MRPVLRHAEQVTRLLRSMREVERQAAHKRRGGP